MGPPCSTSVERGCKTQNYSKAYLKVIKESFPAFILTVIVCSQFTDKTVDSDHYGITGGLFMCYLSVFLTNKK